jgi:phosphatidylinositol glycan class Q protein
MFSALSLAFSYLHCKSIPLSLRAMFQSYFELSNRIRKHYLSPSVILSLITGQFVPPIDRRDLYSLQYSMLPAKRVSISELWGRLNGPEELPRTSGSNGYTVSPAKLEIPNPAQRLRTR